MDLTDDWIYLTERMHFMTFICSFVLLLNRFTFEMFDVSARLSEDQSSKLNFESYVTAQGILPY